MASFEKLAEKYAARLREATNPETALARVINDINSLVYPGTNRRLASERKLELAELIAERLDEDRDVGMAREGDNRKYLDMVKMLKALLR